MSTENELPHASEGLNVLLVEDNPDAAETTKLVMELMGHKVEHADNGNDAITLARDFHPDVVLCDIGLPGMNGYEVGAKLRVEHPVCKLIALTGYGQQEDFRRAKDAGFDLHLTKPVDPAVLETTLQKHLESLRTRDGRSDSTRSIQLAGN